MFNDKFQICDSMDYSDYTSINLTGERPLYFANRPSQWPSLNDSNGSITAVEVRQRSGRRQSDQGKGREPNKKPAEAGFRYIMPCDLA